MRRFNFNTHTWSDYPKKALITLSFSSTIFYNIIIKRIINHSTFLHVRLMSTSNAFSPNADAVDIGRIAQSGQLHHLYNRYKIYRHWQYLHKKLYDISLNWSLMRLYNLMYVYLLTVLCMSTMCKQVSVDRFQQQLLLLNIF